MGHEKFILKRSNLDLKKFRYRLYWRNNNKKSEIKILLVSHFVFLLWLIKLYMNTQGKYFSMKRETNHLSRRLSERVFEM